VRSTQIPVRPVAITQNGEVMHLIQILLPLFDNTGKAISKARFSVLSAELTHRFGGLTAYSHSPAEGKWKKRSGKTKRDQIVVYEVMSKNLDRTWWGRKRGSLEKEFRQQRIVIRGYKVAEL
jgi:hypothetical protein